MNENTSKVPATIAEIKSLKSSYRRASHSTGRSPTLADACGLSLFHSIPDALRTELKALSLRGTRPILILDKSTSSLGARKYRQCTWLSLTPLTGLKDHGTDALVQATLREIMADARVLCAVRKHLLYALDA